MKRKTYRHVCRSLKDKLEKKYHNITVAFPLSFSDKVEFENITLLICVDGNISDIKEVIKGIKSLGEEKSDNNNSILFKYNNIKSIEVRFEIYDSIDKMDYNHFLKSYDIFEEAFNKIVSAYDCIINEKGLFSNNILISDNMSDILKMFGYKNERFTKPFTERQFYEYLVGSVHFCPSKIYIDKSDNLYLNNFFSFIEEHRNLFIQNPNIQLMNEIETYINPSNTITRLKDNIKKRSTNVYVSLLNAYIHKSTNINLIKLETQYKNYLNSVIECYKYIFREKKQSFLINKEIYIDIYQNRIASIETMTKIFKLIYNNKKIDLSFKTQIDINLKQLYIYPVLDTEDNDLKEAANRLIDYLINELNVDFSFSIRDDDIQTIMYHNYVKERERLRELK